MPDTATTTMNSNVQPSSLPTALDLLPTDELDQILRYFSNKPCNPKWERLMQTNELVTLSRCGGALTAAARRRISVLMLVLAQDGDSERLRDVFEILGPYCSELQMVALRVAGSPVWHAAYAQHCTALRTLSLTLGPDAPSIASFLAPISGTLRNLRVECNPAAVGALYTAVTRHCRALESLDLHVGFRNAPGLTKMLWNIGGSLEKLALTVRDAMLPPDVSDTEGLNLPTLARQCPKLSEFELYGDLKGARGSAEMLLLLLGSRLRRLSFPYLGLRVGFLPRITECCPNVMIDTNVSLPALRPDDFLHGERPNPAPTMRILGKQLDAFSFRDGFRRDASFADAAIAASALRELTIAEIRDGGNQLLSEMFSKPRTQLAELRLTFKPAAIATISDSLGIVACNTGGLLTLNITSPPLSRKCLESLADMNPSLNNVSIVRNVAPDDKLNAVLTAMDSFMASKCLQSFSTSDAAGRRWRRPSQDMRVRVRCRNFRERRAAVTIDEVVYVK